ncbi:hypothetical protein GCK72_015507 [Caenorhabditis remanei]|uniref:Tyrosine-protein phosphatase domain-containing protein n=1 Tax=Caenorhabditis remanei TaxID=31234 RepID=A0A6A5GV58_CAERE|nr:hypothetical protein GCK72_015507 [Caenorhabditis remanei]KAF1759047.1 hypothetical protein GCK72_015507 [Caenorhabditis remanei]
MYPIISAPTTTIKPKPYPHTTTNAISTSPPRTNPPDRGFKYNDLNDDESDLTTESNFLIFLTKISSIARLANTIKLQSDIMNHSGIDNTIGELLNLGPSNASDLRKLKISGLNKFMDVLKTTIQSIDMNNYVKDGERYISVCEGIRVGAKPIRSNSPYSFPFSFRAEFYKKVEGFLYKFNDSVIDNALGKLRSISTTLQTVQTYSLDELVFENEVIEVVRGFQNLSNEMEDAKNDVIQLKEHIASLSDYQYFKDEYERNPELEKPMILIGLAETCRDFRRVKIPSSVQRVLKRNFGILDDMKEFVKSLGSVFDFIETNMIKYPNAPSADLKGFGAISQLSSEIDDHSLNGLLKNQTNIEKLMDGLSPIFTAQKTSKLANISFSTNQKTRDVVSNIYSIVRDLNEISSKVGNQDSIFNDYRHCLNTSEYFLDGDLPNALVHEADMCDNLYILSMFWIDYQKLTTELTNITSLITLKDPNDILVSYTEISKVHVQLKSILNELQKSLDNFKKIPIYFTAKSFYYDIQKVLRFKDSIRGELENEGFSNEYMVHNCLEKIGSRSRDVFLASRLIRKLAAYVGSEQFILLKTYFDSLKNPVKLFKAYKSIGNKMMKKSEKKKVHELNKIDWSLATTIDRAVTGFKNVLEVKKLVELKMLERLLRNKLSVRNEIVKIRVWSIYRKLHKKWRKVYDVIARIEMGLEFFENWIQKKDISTLRNISEYGSFFTGFEKMPDMWIDDSLLEVLDYVIPLVENGTLRNELIILKSKLNRMASMDLKFSKYNYEKVPEAFGKFDKFLNEFFSEDLPIGSEEVTEDWTIYYMCLLLLIFILITGIVLFILWYYKLLCFKQRKNRTLCSVVDMDADDKTVNPLTEDLLVIMVVNASMGAIQQKYELWMELMKMVVNETRNENRAFPYVQLAIRKNWDVKLPLNPWTALQSIRIHANTFMTRIGNIFTVTQGPMNASDDHDDTRIDFLSLIVKDEVEYAVMIGQAQSEDDPKDPNLCAAYFSQGPGGSVKIGPFTVETLDEAPFMCQGTAQIDVTLRTLKITDKRKKKVSRTIKHFHMSTWNDEDIPPFGYEMCYQVMQTIIKSKKPILVHNTKGVGSAMAFVGLEYTSRMMEYHEEYTYKDAFGKLIEKRYCSFQNARQIGWMHVGSIFFTSRNHNLDMYMFNQMNNVFLEVDRANSGVPKNENGVKWC